MPKQVPVPEHGNAGDSRYQILIDNIGEAFHWTTEEITRIASSSQAFIVGVYQTASRRRLKGHTHRSADGVTAWFTHE